MPNPDSVTFLPSYTPDASTHQVRINKSLVRAHAARVVHNRHREAIKRTNRFIPWQQIDPVQRDSTTTPTSPSSQSWASNPPLYKNPSTVPWTLHENRSRQGERSLQFFLVKTATEWSGWYDAELWRVRIPQASTVHSCVRHGLIALGAYHEAVEIAATDPQRSERLKQFTTAKAQLAVSFLFQEHEALPASVKLSAYIIISAISSFLLPTAYTQALILQHNFKEQLDAVRKLPSSMIPQPDLYFITHYLDPSLDRQRSKFTQALDSQWALRVARSTDFSIDGPVQIPKTFRSLFHSCTVLEQVLKWTTFQVKTCTTNPTNVLLEGDGLMQMWLTCLREYADSNRLSRKDELTVKILTITAKISMILITTMNEDDEMAFDKYTADFRELADIFIEANTVDQETSQTNVNFGIENSFMSLCGSPVVRWCRQPDIRRDFIRAFRATDRHEGMELAWVWAELFELTQKIEEKGIQPPPVCCGDIPLENRRRIISLAVFWKAYLLRIQYLHYPYRDTDVEEHWIPHPGWSTIFASPPKRDDVDGPPEVLCGRGFFSMLRPESSGDYYTIANPKYYFNIPRV